MTEEQERKAIEALMDRLPMSPKNVAFDNHLKAVEWVEAYNLPYRISLDYLKGYSREYVYINPCYPYPGFCKKDLLHLKESEFIVGNNLEMTPREEATRQKVKECCDKLRPWNLSTAAGRKQWEYYFGHFIGLKAACLDSFTWFDWFGEKTATEEKKQQKQIKYWFDLSKKYIRNPAAFMQEEPPYLPSYDEEYTQLEFIPEWGNTQPGKL